MAESTGREHHEMQDLPLEGNALGETSNEHDIQDQATLSLPAHDGGRAAWTLLLAAFVFEALLWGFPLSFGVFQDYYTQLPQFSGNPYVSVIGTTASGISYMAAPVAIPATKRFSKYRRHMIFVGWPLCLLSLIAGSFATNLGTLIFTQGIMYGTGFVVFYYPVLSMVNEFWITRRGMAYGLLCSASGLAGAAMPFCNRFLLETYGYHITLRVIAVALFLLTAPLVPFLKGRLPQSAEPGPQTRTDWSFLKTPLFWVYSASNLAMGLGYFFPSLYLPSYATANGLSTLKAALLLALMSLSQVFGQLSYGYLSDRNLSINILTASSALIAAIIVYAAWGIAHTFGVLVAFALIYGFFAAGYTATWARMGSKISSEPSTAFTAFGLLNFQKGIGNVLAGPIGGSLLSNAIEVGRYGAGKYEAVVLFTGSCMLLSAATIPICYAVSCTWTGPRQRS